MGKTMDRFSAYLIHKKRRRLAVHAGLLGHGAWTATVGAVRVPIREINSANAYSTVESANFAMMVDAEYEDGSASDRFDMAYYHRKKLKILTPSFLNRVSGELFGWQ